MATKNNGNRVVAEVFSYHYSRKGDYFLGYAVWEGNNICQNPWTKEEALKILSKGGKVFSGHRNCPGKRCSAYVERALNAWAENWYSQIDKVYGPSSWTVDISVRDGRVYADDIEILPGASGPQNEYLSDCFEKGQTI
jgi:hypothetical protein